MKIIFLDIDGVLNHQQFYTERHEKALQKTWDVEYPYSEFCPRTISCLNTLCNETEAKVVISSTWRKRRTVEELKEILKTVGFTGEVIDKTPVIRDEWALRGNEILMWIKQNKDLVGEYYQFTEYVILDDDSDFLYWQRNNFLLIDRFVGLTLGQVFQAKKILNGGKILDSREL